MEQKELQQHLEMIGKLSHDLKGFVGQIEEQKAKTGKFETDILDRIEKVQQQMDAQEKQAALRQYKAGDNGSSAFEKMKENFERMAKHKSGDFTCDLSGSETDRLFGEFSQPNEIKTARYGGRKSIVSSSGAAGQSDVGGTIGIATSGVLPIDRLGGITMEARPALRLRQQFVATPTEATRIDYVKVSTAMSQASPQTETTAKAENQLNVNTAFENVQVLATWIPASRQILDDMQEIQSLISDALPFYVSLAEENAFLFGDGTGTNLHGITPQALAFDTTLLPSSFTKIDCVGHAVQQVGSINEIDPTFVVMNSKDAWDIRMTKDSFGRYLIGDPQAQGPFRLWGLNVVESNNMKSSKFMVGSGNPICATIRDRMGMKIDVSYSHSDYFTRNLIAIRCEIRTCMIVRRPNSFIYGTLSTA